MKLSFLAAALASAIAVCEGSTKMVIGYFPNWLYANYPVENIPYSKYTHINYAFAILNNPDNLPSFSDDWAVESYLPKIVNNAHQSKTKVLLSVGGWTGSKRFSPMVASKASHWEYPAKQAAGCNEFADNDADNFLLLLKELRLALDTKFPSEYKEISMAVHVQPFIKSGTPMTDLKEFVPYFDHVNLMTYDMNGAWSSTTGPNAPFQYKEGKGAPFSFVDSIKQWKAAGVPAEKITAGLAFYGRTMKANVNMIDNPTDQYQSSQVGAPKGDSDDAYWNDPYCNVEAGGVSGIWKWTNLRKEGLLKDDFTTPGQGWVRHWDDVSQTPWLFNPTTQNYITYDDPQSLNIKVQHALCEDLAGVMVWDIHQDNGELLDVVNKIHNPISSSACQSITANDQPKEEQKPSVPDIDDEYGDLDEWFPSQTSIESARPSSQIASKSSIQAPMSSASSLSLPSLNPQLSLTASAVPEVTGTSQPSSNSVLDGKACSILGQQKCVQSGQSGKWVTCNFNQWIERDCAANLVCIDNQASGSLYCDLPSDKLRNRAARVKASKQSASLSAKALSSSALSSNRPLATNNHLHSLAVERPIEHAAYI